jgi:enediyne biosynthesis protein E4
MLKLSAAVAVCMATAGQAQSAENKLVIPSFVDETTSSGITGSYTGEWEFMVGGGVATFDCNSDGFDDVFIAGGSSLAKLYQNDSKAGGALKFEPKTSGLELDKVTGGYPLDIDSDGIMDLVLLRVGENIVMRGLGQCQFERANEAWGFDGGDAWSTSFSATWEHRADWPTLAVGNYINRHEDTSPWGTCTDNWLHRPEGKKFGAPFALKPSYCALSMLFTDWNRSGTASLRVSNDREYYEGGQEQLWHVKPQEAPNLYTEKEGWKPLKVWGMGIASYDLNFDGYPDYFLTSMADQKLQVLAAPPVDGKVQPTFKDVAFAKGVTAHRPFMGTDLRPSTGWHAQFEDMNNDGMADLFIAKGNVAKMPDFANADPNNLLLQTADGKFVEAADKAGVASVATSRGAALADFNMDGLIDLLVVNHGAPTQIWRNTTTGAGHWIEIKLVEPAHNRDAVGAWLEVKHGDTIMRREITVGGGHASGQMGWWHFGLGDQAQTEMRVTWPDGTSAAWQTLDADHFYIMDKTKSPATLWHPQSP